MVAVATILVAMERVTADIAVDIRVTRWATALIPSIDQASVSSLVLGAAAAIEVGLVATMEAGAIITTTTTDSLSLDLLPSSSFGSLNS